jgi:threonine dehydrogenase-like Zn-dependent dehydrogenase
MRAIVLDRPGTFRVAEVPDPAPRPTEIVIKADCCGICGTDLHILAGEFPPTPYPITPGQLGAMAEPLSCAVHGLRRLGPVMGSRVALIGAGTMGLLLLQLLVHAGAGPVAVVDRIASRLEIARKLGAAQAVQDAAELDGARFEVAAAATGAPAVIETAIALLDRGGRMLVFGVSPAEAVIRVPPFRVYNDELTIVGSMAVLRSFGPAVDLLTSGAVDPGALLWEPLPLEQFGEAVNRVRSGQGIKWHIRPS